MTTTAQTSLPATIDTDPKFVLTIDHVFGSNVSIHRTREGALNETLAFVSSWWEKEMGAEALPEDRDAAITAYFERVEGVEDYSIVETLIVD